jgi:hypothetical protein
MNVSEAEVLLTELASRAGQLATEIGVSGESPHTFAYLRMSSPTDAGDFAIVSTPGDGWFELSVAGGYTTGETGDMYSQSDVREILDRYVSAALRYLDGDWSERKSNLFRVPYVELNTDTGTIMLRLPVNQVIKRAFGQ